MRRINDAVLNAKCAAIRRVFICSSIIMYICISNANYIFDDCQPYSSETAKTCLSPLHPNLWGAVGSKWRCRLVWTNVCSLCYRWAAPSRYVSFFKRRSLLCVRARCIHFQPFCQEFLNKLAWLMATVPVGASCVGPHLNLTRPERSFLTKW